MGLTYENEAHLTTGTEPPGHLGVAPSRLGTSAAG